MNVIGPDVSYEQPPAPIAADLTNGLEDEFAPGRVEQVGELPEALSLIRMASGVCRKGRRIKPIVIPVHGAALVAMQPGAEAGKRKEVRERAIRHDRLLHRLSEPRPSGSGEWLPAP
jgi:hypothetical protein